MIMSAIELSNDKNGINKSTISKFIESTYGDVPTGHSALLSDHLNKMKDNGELVFWKNNYMKPDPNGTPKRGRGRPPKPKQYLPEEPIFSLPKPRGRPPKDPNTTPKSPKDKVSSGSGKPRGRPRKMARPSGGLDVSTGTPTITTTGKPRGRPPKVKETPLQEVSVQ